jgi:aspartate 1-decarboxylase
MFHCVCGDKIIILLYQKREKTRELDLKCNIVCIEMENDWRMLKEDALGLEMTQ